MSRIAPGWLRGISGFCQVQCATFQCRASYWATQCVDVTDGVILFTNTRCWMRSVIVICYTNAVVVVGGCKCHSNGRWLCCCWAWRRKYQRQYLHAIVSPVVFTRECVGYAYEFDLIKYWFSTLSRLVGCALYVLLRVQCILRFLHKPYSMNAGLFAFLFHTKCIWMVDRLY